MIDLTSKNVNDVNVLIQKYVSVLELFHNKQNHIPALAYVIDKCVDFTNQYYSDIDVGWKQWISVIVINKYLSDNINNDDDISELIVNFMEYKNKHYASYVNNITIYATEFDRDYDFIRKYLKK